jgi:Na+/phosphate symporter
MGTSLADGAWGRESAVYRVSGVLSVIGGWFFTALSAFTVAFVLAMIFSFGGIYAIVGMLLIAGFVIFRTHRLHNKRIEQQVALEKSIEEGTLTKVKVIGLCATQLKSFMHQYGELVDQSLTALGDEDLGNLNRVNQAFKPVLRKIQSLKINSSNALERVPEHELEAGHLYILTVDYLEEMGKQVNNIIKSNLDHVDNNHKPLLPAQIDELKSLHDEIKTRYKMVSDIFKNMDGAMLDKLYDSLPAFVQKTRNIRKNQIKRIKNREVNTRNSVLYLNHLGEFRNLSIFSNRIVKVFDELILNPIEDTEFTPPSEIKKELKEMKKEARSIIKDKSDDVSKDADSDDLSKDE